MPVPDADRARALMELNRHAEARALLTGMVAADPDDPDLLCLLAQSNLALDDHVPAARAAEAACRLAPELEWPHRLAALALRPVSYERAYRYAIRAVALDPQDWRTHLAVASVEQSRGGRSQIGLDAARTAVRLGPNEASPHVALGTALLGMGDRDGAAAALQQALRLDPQSAAARNELARLELARRNIGRAASGFAESAALDPTNRTAVQNLLVVGVRALRVVHLIIWAVLITAGRVAVESRRYGHDAAVVGFVVAIVALAVFAWRLHRGAGPRTLQLGRFILRRDRMLAAWFGLLMTSFALLGAAALVPVGAVPVVIGVSFVSLLAGWIITLVRARRLRTARA